MSTDAAAAPADSLQPDWSSYSRKAALAAIAGLVLFVVAGGINIASASGEEGAVAAKSRLMSSYLVGYTFWFSLPIGGMALLMIGYLAKTSWGLLLRRPLEAASRTWPLLAVLLIPLAVSVATDNASPYWWTHPDKFHVEGGPTPDEVMAAGNEDKRTLAIEAGKAMIRKTVEIEREDRAKGNYGFLSTPAYIGVGIVLYAIWGTMIFLLNKWSRDGDAAAGNQAAVEATLKKRENLSGPGLIIYAITITAASTQWVMSVEPSWSSTMFPVIFAVNQFLTAFAFCLSLFLFVVGKPPFRDLMRPKFQLDMGTLMLAFTLFWSYTSFSQFMLVWIGNLPEEIPFYLNRSEGGWWYVSAGLCVLHFALPFLLLLFRDIKLHPVRLRNVALYLLVICAIDVVWWIEPTIHHDSSFLASLMDLGSIVGIGGLWGVFFVSQMKKNSLLPMGDTYRLPEGHHEHH